MQTTDILMLHLFNNVPVAMEVVESALAADLEFLRLWTITYTWFFFTNKLNANKIIAKKVRYVVLLLF